MRTLTEHHYKVIYADPPWRFKNYSEKGEGRNAVSHYDCLSLEQLREIQLDQLIAKDCVLFMWAIDPMMPEALDLIRAWGFEFKTVAFYWAKVNKKADMTQLTEHDFFTGMGYWTRANVEQCLLATKGKPSRKAKDVRKLIIDKRREHSRKPDETYQRIERLVDGPYLELFARQPRKGWDVWGDQTDLFSNGSVNTRRRPSKWNNQLTGDDPHPRS